MGVESEAKETVQLVAEKVFPFQNLCQDFVEKKPNVPILKFVSQQAPKAGGCDSLTNTDCCLACDKMCEMMIQVSVGFWFGLPQGGQNTFWNRCGL